MQPYMYGAVRLMNTTARGTTPPLVISLHRPRTTHKCSRQSHAPRTGELHRSRATPSSDPPASAARHRRGVGHLASRHPDIPVIPVYLDGLYRTLPKGRTLIVPFGGTLVMGDPLSFPAETSIDAITEKAQLAIEAMAHDLLDENKIPSSDSP